MTFEPLLSVQKLHKAFGGLTAVNQLSFDVSEGSIVGLLGPNGSGKTTAINLLSGALSPDSGQVHLEGRALAQAPHRISHQGVARTFQLVRILPELSCAENVMAGLAFRRRPLWGQAANGMVAELLRRVGLSKQTSTLAENLTYIDQKRLELARALGQEPKLLLLDEWLAGLNPSELREGVELIGKLKAEGMTVLMVEHVMSAIRSLCDRCIVMNAGAKIAEGPPDQVLAEPEVVRAYLGDAYA